jgi:type I restriction enzyme S subunit
MEVRKGYKQTEIGIIPEDWDTKKLGEIGECIIGLTYKPSDVQTDGLLVLRSSNVGDGRLKFEDNVFVDVEVPERLIVRKNDVLICVRNGSRNLIGKCALIDEKTAGMTFGAFMSVFRTEYGKFVFYQFQSDIIKKQISENIGATINQITNKDLNSFEIPFPRNQVEQQAIAAALSDVDSLLTALDSLIAKKRLIKQGAMQELLTGKRRLPGFSSKWSEVSLSSIGKFSKGRGIKKDETTSDGIPCIRYGEIYIHHNDYIRKFYSFISPEIAKQSQRINKGDLLFTGSGETAEGIGKCVAFLGNEEAYAGGDVVIFIPSKQNSLYLGYLMNHASIVTQKARMAQGDAIVHISAQKLGQLNLNLPTIEEQTAIAKILSDMDAEITALESRREKTRLLKQGMMSELLTGRIRLK